MGTVFSLLCVSYIVLPMNSQRVTIWNSSFISNVDDWDIYGEGSIEYDSACPAASSCYALKNDGWIWRYTSTVGYHSVQVTLAVKTEGLSQDEECQICYITDRSDLSLDDWIKIYGFLADTAKTITISLPVTASDNAIVGVSFHQYGGEASDRCRINNAFLSGILMDPILIAIEATSVNMKSTENEQHINPQDTVINPWNIHSSVITIICIFQTVVILCICGAFLVTLYSSTRDSLLDSSANQFNSVSPSQTTPKSMNRKNHKALKLVKIESNSVNMGDNSITKYNPMTQINTPTLPKNSDMTQMNQTKSSTDSESVLSSVSESL